jgi:hypothetical protein
MVALQFPGKNYGQVAGFAPRKDIGTILKVTTTASSFVPRNSSIKFKQ